MHTTLLRILNDELTFIPDIFEIFHCLNYSRTGDIDIRIPPMCEQRNGRGTEARVLASSSAILTSAGYEGSSGKCYFSANAVLQISSKTVLFNEVAIPNKMILATKSAFEFTRCGSCKRRRGWGQ